MIHDNVEIGYSIFLQGFVIGLWSPKFGLNRSLTFDSFQFNEWQLKEWCRVYSEKSRNGNSRIWGTIFWTFKTADRVANFLQLVRSTFILHKCALEIDNSREILNLYEKQTLAKFYYNYVSLLLYELYRIYEKMFCTLTFSYTQK